MTILPTGTAYRGEHVQLDLPVLEPGSIMTIAAPHGTEAAVVLLSGDVTVGGSVEPRDVARYDVFDARATAVYLPPGTAIEMTAHERTELALAATVDGVLPTPPGAAPAIIESHDIVVNDRGKPGWQRQVHDIVADAVPAQRLLVGETFNAAGQWSSYPPHKHDGRNGEPALEEVYYYRFDRPDGFGFQGLYDLDADEPATRAVLVRHGSVVGIPHGYHPVSAAPGYRLYYLWALSAPPGASRALALYEDPAHRWLHDAG